MSDFFSKRLDRIEEYVPGEQPRNRDYIKLNTNESPFPPSPKVIEAVNADEISSLNLYSDPESLSLKMAIASKFGVDRRNVFVGNGSDEVLSFAFMAYCDESVGAAFADVTYGFYRVFAKLYGVDFLELPLKEDYSICVDDYCDIGRTVFIANPNAPTGIALPKSEIARIVRENPNNIVVVDEAYVDFGGESCADLIDEYSNLIVCMTFSKSRSLAGARLGFALANEKLINDLERIKFSTNPYNINRLTTAAGIAAIQDDEYYDMRISEIKDNRAFTVNALESMGFDVADSSANFIFAKHPKMSGDELYTHLKEAGILVRYFAKERLRDRVRITIGTRSQMEALVAEIKQTV